MVSIEQLDEVGLRSLAARTDPLGVLSVYVNHDARRDPNLQAATIDLRNRFRELEHRIAEDATSDQSRSRAAALRALWPEVESLASSIVSGRSRMVFAALDGEWMLKYESEMPVTNRMVLGDGPFIHPLLELLDEGRAAGVVIVSGDDARLLEWRLGTLDLVNRMEQEYIEAPHERAGQIGGGPQGQFDTPRREQRQAREDDRMQRFLGEVAKAVGDLAVERGWERIFVSAGQRWTQPTISRLPQSMRDKAYAETRILNGLDDTALRSAVTELAHQQHMERERQIVETVRAAGQSGTGALGLSEVAAALNAGRVAHLIYDPGVRYTGSVGADGELYGGDETGPEGQRGPTAEPRLTERLVEQALKTGARISPIEGAADGDLNDAAGIAALLRW